MKGLTEQMLPILERAGKAIMEVYQDEALFETEYKADHSPLTVADRKSNRIICDALGELYPDIPIISEENRQASYEIRSAYTSYFLVDPLDGTREFIKRNGEFTINVAYLVGANPVAGYVYVPIEQRTFIGERHQGAWSINHAGVKTGLQSKPFYLAEPGIKVVASRSHRDPLTNQIISMLDAPEIVSVGSALKFLKIAEGHAHFYPRLAPTMEWDTAAAQCVLEEAGGSVLRFDNRLPVAYNKPELLSPYFIAAGAMLDPEYLELILSGLQSGLSDS